MSDLTKKIQLVIPMAGLGSRFSEAGYPQPKPLLPIQGIPMYKIVIANLMHETVSSITVVCPVEWGLGGEIRGLSAQLGVPVNVVEIDYVTQGPAQTVLLAEPLLDANLPVVTANSDQYINADLGEFYASITEGGIGGAILCMEDSDPKWSYVKLSNDGFVSEVREKVVISRLATVGLYGFKTATLMFAAIRQMIEAEDTSLGEYYVAPSFHYLIRQGYVISAMSLGPVGEVMHGLGVPADYEIFLKRPVAGLAKDKAMALIPS